MIEIITKRGVQYTFDPSTQRIFRGDVYLPRTLAEPVYSGNSEDGGEPIFSGIYLSSSNEIVTRTGNVKKVIDINSIR